MSNDGMIREPRGKLQDLVPQSANEVDPPLAHNKGQKLLPLTHAQRGIWIASKVSGIADNFNISEAVEIQGRINERCFIEALRQLTVEAETLRTNVIEDASGPHQLIHSQYQGEFQLIDVSDEDAPFDAAMDWMKAEWGASPVLERDPLWATALLKLGEDRYFWYQRAHHIVGDGFSAGLVSRRLAEIYNAQLIGRDIGPPAFDSLSTLVSAEQEYRLSPQFQKDRDYWLARTADMPQPVSFAQGRWPTDLGHVRKSVLIDEETSNKLSGMAKSMGGSRAQLLIALAAAYVHCTTGVLDLSLGFPVTGRTKKVRRTPGMFANASVLRFQIDEETTLAQVMKQASREVRNTLRHQQYRYEDLRKDLGLTGRYDHIARIGINIEPFNYDLRFGGHKTVAHNVSNSSVGDLVIFIYDREDGNGLRIDLDANPTLYSGAELDGHAGRLRSFIAALIARPDQPLADIQLVSDEEQRLLLSEWQGEIAEVPDESIASRIVSWASETPEAVAVRDGASSLSYRALVERATKLAAHLADRGVAKGDYVAIAVPRSADLAVAFLGTMMIGAVIVPVDVTLPAARLDFILSEVDPKVVVLGSEAPAALDLRQFANRALSLEPDSGDGASAQSLPSVHMVADDPAYVIFTSGSTGNPNGVVATHGGLSNLLEFTAEMFGLDGDSRYLSTCPPSFDPIMSEVLSPLVKGSRLLIPPIDSVRDPGILCRLIRAEGVTAVLATPALWTAMIERREAYFKGVKAASGGDRLPLRLARTLMDLGAEVLNLYGPTETTVKATRYDVTSKDRSDPPIGRPCANVKLYVLSENKSLLPIGMAGELYIGGEGVAHGYLNNSDLTAARFLPDPFGPDGARMFRTGDMVRWRNDGNLEFLGRFDNQIKVRGFRIEPGEVESALEAGEGVADAIVMAWEDPILQTGKRLVAYVTPRDGAALDGNDLKAHLSHALPAHMIPSTITVLDTFPMTRNGKVDRRALPAPQGQSSSAFAAAETETEQKLVGIVSHVLGIDGIGVEDSLFDLGCDSLTAVQLLVEIETQFGQELSLNALLEKPTIRNLAQQIDNKESGNPFASVFGIRTNATGVPLFCIHPLIGVSWVYANLLRSLGSETPLYGLQAAGLQAPGMLPEDIKAMASTYVPLMRELQPEGPYHLLGWSFGGLVAHEIAGQLEDAGASVGSVTLIDAFPPRRGLKSARGAAQLWMPAIRSFIGVNEDMEVDGDARDVEAAAAELFKALDVGSLPLIRNARLDDIETQQAFLRVVASNLTILSEHKPRRIKSDITLYRATADKDKLVQSMIDVSDGAWAQFCTGKVTEHDIETTHNGIMMAEPLSEIGDRLARQIAGLTI